MIPVDITAAVISAAPAALVLPSGGALARDEGEE
jgi:hypothetical protein